MACAHTSRSTSIPCSQCLNVRARRLDPVEVAPISIVRTLGTKQINRGDWWSRFWTQARTWRPA